MKAIVIYPKRATFIVELPDKISGLVAALSYVWDDCQAGIEEILGRESTIDKANSMCGAKLRSSMVGDLIILDDRYFMVNGCGFIEVNPPQFFQLQLTDERDRIMGWKWLKQKNLVEGEPVSEIV